LHDFSLGYGAVAANYVLGIVVMITDPVFVLYCAIAAIAWTAAAICAAYIVSPSPMSPPDSCLLLAHRLEKEVCSPPRTFSLVSYSSR